MLRSFLFVLISVLLVLSLTACLTDAERIEIQKTIDESRSKPVASSVKSSGSGSESVDGETETQDKTSSTTQESGSTQLDNKPPNTESQGDGITIHIPQSELEEFSNELSDIASSLAEYSWPDVSYDVPTFSSRDDIVFSEPEKWKEHFDGGSNPDKYPWEIESNIPEIENDVPIPPFTGQGEGDTGYRGGTLPDFSDIPTDSIEYEYSIPPRPTP